MRMVTPGDIDADGSSLSASTNSIQFGKYSSDGTFMESASISAVQTTVPSSQRLISVV